MSERVKSWGPVVLAGAMTLAQIFMGRTLDAMSGNYESLDRRVGAIEVILMSSKK